MRVLWDRHRATVSDVLRYIEGRPTPAYNTVLTILGILERKRYVTHEKEGRAFAYLPLIQRREARRRALSHMLHRFFDDSPELLVLDLIGHEQVDTEEVRRVRELLESAPRDADDSRVASKSGRRS